MGERRVQVILFLATISLSLAAVVKVKVNTKLLRTIPSERLTHAQWPSYHIIEPDGPGTYAYGYEIDDPVTGNLQFKDEERWRNGTIAGTYGLVLPDGSVTITKYTADGNGFRAETTRRQKLGAFKHVSSIVTPATHSTQTHPSANIPSVPGVAGLGSPVAPQILPQGAGLGSDIDPVTASNGGPPNGVQSDEGFGLGPQQGFGHHQQHFQQHPGFDQFNGFGQQPFHQRPLPYFPFQMRQNQQQQQYHQQLPPLPVYVNGLPPQFQSPFSSHHHQAAAAFNQQQQNPFFNQQQQQFQEHGQFLGQQQPQGIQQYTSNPNNNILSDDLSPSSIATQITNQISSQTSSSQGPSNWWEQLGQNIATPFQSAQQAFQNFGQNIGNGFNTAFQNVNAFGQNIGQGFSSFFNPGNGRYYAVGPVGFHNVVGIKRDLDFEKERSAEDQLRISPLSKEADWYKNSVGEKQQGVRSKIAAEFDGPIEYHH